MSQPISVILEMQIHVSRVVFIVIKVIDGHVCRPPFQPLEYVIKRFRWRDIRIWNKSWILAQRNELFGTHICFEVLKTNLHWCPCCGHSSWWNTSVGPLLRISFFKQRHRVRWNLLFHCLPCLPILFSNRSIFAGNIFPVVSIFRMASPPVNSGRSCSCFHLHCIFNL